MGIPDYIQKARLFTREFACFAALALLPLAGCGGSSPAPSTPSGPASQWVYYNSSGNLTYKTLDAQGDKIMDFSTAGYEQGAAAIPTAPVEVTVSPSGGDDTANIQAAINTVSAMALNPTTGLRGAVLLEPGSYTVSGSLAITTMRMSLNTKSPGTVRRN